MSAKIIFVFLYMPSLGTSAERIAWLASINNAKSYLEVGVNQGTTFNSELLDFFAQKVAVDPAFSFNISDYVREGTYFFSKTSDQFFTENPIPGFLADIIFLDGLHTFQQTFRDFCCSLSRGSSTCIWIIDDVKPLSIAQAEPDMKIVKALKEIIGEDHGWWMGDVYKTLIAIHDFFPTFSIAVLPGMTGQAVVWPQPREDFKPVFDSLGKIDSMRYQDFLLLQESIFKPVEYDDVSMMLQSWINGEAPI